MMFLSSLLALTCFIGTAAAVPTVDLTFAWGNLFQFLYLTIFVTGLWILAPFTGWSMGQYNVLAGENLVALRKEMQNRWGGFYYAVPWFIPGIVKLALQIASWVIFAGYLLDQFEDSTTGQPQNITVTWKPTIVVLAAVSYRLDLLAAEWFNRLMWFGPAAFIGLLEMIGWGVTVGFLIAEMLQLPSNIDVIWAICFSIVAGLYFLLSTYYLGLYTLGAMIGRREAFEQVEKQY